MVKVPSNTPRPSKKTKVARAIPLTTRKRYHLFIPALILRMEISLACSSLSVLEVELGMKKDEEKQTANLLDSLHVISVDRGIAGKAASCIRHYQTRGRHIDFVDAVIAATCLRENRVLVTYNLKHYPMPEIRKQTPSEQE